MINRCCLDKPTKPITCLWGGLLYIIVPQNSKLGSVPITVKGAVHAPYYKLGEWILLDATQGKGSGLRQGGDCGMFGAGEESPRLVEERRITSLDSALDQQ